MAPRYETAGRAESGSLPAGLGCRYKSEKSGWISCQILKFHHSDGTYDLDARQRAPAGKIAPLVETGATRHWPVGSFVSYYSRSKDAWLPTEVRSFNSADATYNLSVCEHAHADRIRARSMSAGISQPPLTNDHADRIRDRPTLVGVAQPNLTKKASAANHSRADEASASLPQLLPANCLHSSRASTPQDETAPSIQIIDHPDNHIFMGQDPCGFEKHLVAVVVTICSGESYDPLFNNVPQFAGEGKQVASYAASATSLPYIASALSGTPIQELCAGPCASPLGILRRKLRTLIQDVRSVQPESVVFNWECCSGCIHEHFHNSAIVMDLVKQLLDRGFMVMFSDFSLKALIRDWRENLLGPNPFVKTTELDNEFKLRFDPAMLRTCPSAQLQKLGELARDGKAELHAMPKTIGFSVDWQKADCNSYKCKVLTVMTELDGQPARPMKHQSCEVGRHRGLAGHALLTYPSGGQLLASAGHWVELSRLDVKETDLLEVAASLGPAFQREVQASMSACKSATERRQAVQSYSSRIVQQSTPCCHSRVAAPRRPHRSH